VFWEHKIFLNKSHNEHVSYSAYQSLHATLSWRYTLTRVSNRDKLQINHNISKTSCQVVNTTHQMFCTYFLLKSDRLNKMTWPISWHPDVHLGHRHLPIHFLRISCFFWMPSLILVSKINEMIIECMFLHKKENTNYNRGSYNFSFHGRIPCIGVILNRTI